MPIQPGAIHPRHCACRRCHPRPFARRSTAMLAGFLTGIGLILLIALAGGPSPLVIVGGMQ
jgi:hypothetical protein